MSDLDLKARFLELRQEEEASAPPFPEALARASVTAVRRVPSRRAPLAVAFAVTLLGVLLVLSWRRPTPATPLPVRTPLDFLVSSPTLGGLSSLRSLDEAPRFAYDLSMEAK